MNFFRTPVSLGEFTKIDVTGSVSLANSALSNTTIFPDGLNFSFVDGIKLAVAFLEKIYIDCRTLKGFEYEDQLDPEETVF